MFPQDSFQCNPVFCVLVETVQHLQVVNLEFYLLHFYIRSGARWSMHRQCAPLQASEMSLALGTTVLET